MLALDERSEMTHVLELLPDHNVQIRGVILKVGSN